MNTYSVHLEPAGARWTLIFVRDLAHPPAKVWRALTDPHHLNSWAPFTAGRDLAHPGDVTLTMIDGDEKTDLPSTVRLAEEPTVLEHTWGDDVLRWELTPTAGGTRLTLRHTMDDREYGARTAAGWHLCIDVLGRLLAGEEALPIRGEEALEHGWPELHDAYAERLDIHVHD